MSAPNRPRKVINNTKSSDRRLAAAHQPNKFLHSNQETTIKDSRLLNNSISILNDIKQRKSNTNDRSSPSNSSSNGASSSVTVERMDPKTGRKWKDSTLAEWDPSHFRLFIGNLSPEVTEELLFRTFLSYPSISKIKIPKDGKGEGKGFGFISFSDSEDYLRCFKEMNGKYVGNKPVELKRAKTEIKPVANKGNRKLNKRR